MRTLFYNGKEILWNPKGFPEKVNEKHYSGDQWKEANAESHYEKMLKQVIEEAILVEDQDTVKKMIVARMNTKINPNAIMLVRDDSYEIDQEFETVFQYKHGGWKDCSESQFLGFLNNTFHATRVVARLVPESKDEKDRYKRLSIELDKLLASETKESLRTFLDQKVFKETRKDEIDPKPTESQEDMWEEVFFESFGVRDVSVKVPMDKFWITRKMVIPPFIRVFKELYQNQQPIPPEIQEVINKHL